MINKRLGCMAILFFLLVFSVSASMVSVLLIETGIGEDVSSGQYTSLWEGGLMEAFFDAGHIITNSPIARMERKPDRDFTGSTAGEYADAVNGGVEFLILGYLEYEVRGQRAVPVSVTLKLYSCGSQSLIHEQRFPAGTGTTLDDEYQMAIDAGRAMIPHLSKR